jgi:hypothetical protein
MISEWWVIGAISWGKEGDEESVIEQREVAHQAAMSVHQKRDLLEGDE